jgi:hypothetical protein
MRSNSLAANFGFGLAPRCEFALLHGEVRAGFSS